MTPLKDFFQFDSREDQLIGTYLFPYVLFSGWQIDDPYSTAEIISEINLEDETILITRNGGVFTRIPVELQNDPNKIDLNINALNSRLDFQDKFVDLANRIICEFCLFDLVTEPVTSVHVSQAHLKDNHAWITSGSGGKETYLYRTLEPFLKLQQNTIFFSSNNIDSAILENIKRMEFATKLAEVSDNLPLLTASSYSLFSKQQISEALIDSWIVVEQIIDHLWTKYKSSIGDSSRSHRLSDSRTYSTSVRIEVLYLLNIITLQEYEAFQNARGYRNKLAHRAHINLDWATDGMNAMKLAIEHLVSKNISQPSTSRGINW